MKKRFMCSLICHNGILGGSLYYENNSFTYKTNKLTVNKVYKNIVLKLDEIVELTWKWVIFPFATFHMKNGDKYKFIIFNKRCINEIFQEYYKR